MMTSGSAASPTLLSTYTAIAARCSLRSLPSSIGARELGDSGAQLVRLVIGEQRDLVAARGRMDLDGRKVERRLEQVARGVDVLHTHHRHDGLAYVERAMAEDECVGVHVPAPAAVAHQRHDGDAEREAYEREPANHP